MDACMHSKNEQLCSCSFHDTCGLTVWVSGVVTVQIPYSFYHFAKRGAQAKCPWGREWICCSALTKQELAHFDQRLCQIVRFLAALKKKPISLWSFSSVSRYCGSQNINTPTFALPLTRNHLVQISQSTLIFHPVAGFMTPFFGLALE